jgi:putative transposase
VPQARHQQCDVLRWKAKFVGMDVSEAKRLRRPEDENTKLKRLLVDAMLDNVALRDLFSKNLKPAAKQKAVAHLTTAYEMSERRACQVIRADRKMVGYRSRRPADNELRSRLRELAAEQRRFGYRRLHVLLRHEGHVVNRKKGHSRASGDHGAG